MLVAVCRRKGHVCVLLSEYWTSLPQVASDINHRFIFMCKSLSKYISISLYTYVCVCNKPQVNREIVETLLLPWKKLKGTTFWVHPCPSWGYEMALGMRSSSILLNWALEQILLYTQAGAINLQPSRFTRSSTSLNKENVMQRAQTWEGLELCRASAVTAWAAVLWRAETADSIPSFTDPPALTAPSPAINCSSRLTAKGSKCHS